MDIFSEALEETFKSIMDSNVIIGKARTNTRRDETMPETTTWKSS
ncbi:MAG TPA: hypothetical protein VIH27_03705 [Nitrososphaerales archaeon]